MYDIRYVLKKRMKGQIAIDIVRDSGTPRNVLCKDDICTRSRQVYTQDVFWITIFYHISYHVNAFFDDS